MGFVIMSVFIYLILWITSAGLLTRFDNQLSINFALSLNFKFFSIGTEKVLYFSVLSPKQINCPANSSVSLIVINW